MSKITVVLDSSQLDAFGQCPEMWNNGYLQRLGLIGSYKDALLMGTAGHKMLDVFYKGVSSGMKPHEARDKALDEPIPSGTKFIIVDGDKPIFLDGVHEVEDPIVFALESPDYDIVKARFKDYYMTWAANDFMIRRPEDVEIGFSELIYEDDEKIYVLEGRIDLLAELQGMTVVADNKFQLRKRELYGKSIQFRNYTMVTGRKTFVVNYVRLTKKVDETTFQRQVISFLPSEIDWWRGQVKEMFDHVYIDMMFGTFERRWNACSGKFGYPCEFTKLCESCHNPREYTNIKSQYYQIKSEWRPW